MPHDVIMPALGMAQDTGKIVAWLKQSGDPVKAGEAIMEVETDKATMEVEAQADGFLTGITASAGDDVPVGQPVATISETADEVPAPSPAPVDELQDVAPSGNGLPEGRSIIMPALGMAQDTGLIVAWRKSPGDRVASGDVLLEVETDKSVMEVEAGHDGFVAAILAQAQEAVPVGSVIAIISDAVPESPVSRSLASGPGPNQNPAPEPPANGADAPPQPAMSAAPRPASKPARSTPPGPDMPAAGDRILASPKARRLAQEQGLDLKRLVEHGVAQPFHVADLETLRTLPAVSPTGEASGSAAHVLHITARVSTSGCDDFIRWFAEDGKITLDPASLWLCFAAAALRSAGQPGSDQLVLGVDRPGSDTVHYADPDLTRVSQPQPVEPEASADLMLRDLTGSLLTSVRLTAGACPVLTIGRDDTAYILSLDFTASQLTETEAISFLTDFAERMQEPLRHIL
ncbi:MAG: hypothetical protein KUA43_04140 [Hoeflea sp.]|uniref:biotin/lipoyl-containing protein n=1 Tax=Hoeflea sp. TaxID=1940281 RepID=UPI001D286238|nr:biotin/lipoyl-containing protein [Hoeflea sp.]MBU4531888.1 pyruvate dehydrogenase [Alphaproteobacteria bacterium]MBU4546310.1 pyruvate dehydrogenase [Alphaproteobacteria bacterium]MBU4549439.1 pyruvate dehydrogenase [Alphaproteobacteria bacterium]MBV1722614.1 hypothetical protein [Hoeflea sp.]MBV1782552.1 hypothetical protein [Hoeflea sp.]